MPQLAFSKNSKDVSPRFLLFATLHKKKKVKSKQFYFYYICFFYFTAVPHNIIIDIIVL